MNKRLNFGQDPPNPNSRKSQKDQLLDSPLFFFNSDPNQEKPTDTPKTQQMNKRLNFGQNPPNPNPRKSKKKATS